MQKEREREEVFYVHFNRDILFGVKQSNINNKRDGH